MAMGYTNPWVMEEGLMPLHTYASGSYGPDAAMELLGEDRWWFDDTDQESDLLDAQAEVAAAQEYIRPGLSPCLFFLPI